MKYTPVLLCLLLTLSGCVSSGKAPPLSNDPSNAGSAFSALKSLQEKAAAGDAEAQNELAGDYRDGQGVPQSWMLDYFWNSLAAASPTEVADRATVGRNVAAEHLSETQRALMDQKVKDWKPVQAAPHVLKAPPR